MQWKQFTNQPDERENTAGEASNVMVEDFVLLMSLALDGLLDESQAAEFAHYLASDAGLAQQWQEWQKLNQQIKATPAAAPAQGFAARFETRLLQRERRRRLQVGVAIGVATFLLWGGIVAGVLSLGAFVLFSQPDWLAELAHGLAFWSATLNNWFTSLGSTLVAVLATPQARILGACYVLSAIAILFLWTQFLRSSTRPAEVVSNEVMYG